MSNNIESILEVKMAVAVKWLCSDQAAFVVGHALIIDRGQPVG